MMNKNKTFSSVTITTSGDFVDRSKYSHSKTYSTTPSNESDLSIIYSSIKYGGSTEKLKVYTSVTRKQEELLSINKKLEKLG